MVAMLVATMLNFLDLAFPIKSWSGAEEKRREEMWTKRRIVAVVIAGPFLGVLLFWIASQRPRTQAIRGPHATMEPITRSHSIQSGGKPVASGKPQSGKPVAVSIPKTPSTPPPEAKAPPKEDAKRPSDSSKHPAESSPAEAHQPGYLNVNAQPWARVSVDGKVYGDTPIMLKLSAGQHKVVLEYEGQQIRQTVVIEAGKTEYLTYP